MKKLILIIAAIALLLSLIGCGKPLVRTELIKTQIPALPARPDYYPVIWKGTGSYCLDEQAAKNLLKNKALQDSREKELEMIIEGLR